MMKKKAINHVGSEEYDRFMVEQMRKNPKFLEASIKEAFSEENEDPRVIFDMLRLIAEAEGGMTRLSQVTNLNRQNLYRSLSKNCSPEFSSIFKVVHGLGYHFKIEKDKKSLAASGAR